MRIVALLFALCVPLSLWGVLHFGGAARDMAGPTALHWQDDKVLLAVNGLLLELDARGRVTTRHDLRAAGIDPWVSDLLVADDGSLLVAGGNDGTLQRCEKAAGGELSCRPLPLQGSAASARVPMKLAHGDDALYISDSNRHRVLRIDTETAIATVLARDGLTYPNDIVVADDGLLIVDTNHARIARCPLDEDAGCRPETVVDGFRNTGRPQELPAHLAQASDGTLWAIVVTTDYRDGVLARIDDGIVRVLDIPERGDFIAVEPAGDGVLVVDHAAWRILQVGADGNAVPFGSAAFNTELAAWKDGQARAAELGMYCMYGIFLALLGAAVALALDNHLRKDSPATAADDARVFWLLPARDERPQGSTLAVLALLMLLVPGTLLAGLLVEMVVPTLRGTVTGTVIAGVTIVLAGLFVMQRRRPAPLGPALGLHGTQLLVRDDRRNDAWPLADVSWSARALFLPNGEVVALYDGNRPCYDETAVQDHLMTRLLPAQEVRGAMLRRP